jgi:membrane-associated phospholipid phosphatase
LAERTTARHRSLGFLTLAAAAILLAHVLDPWTFRFLRIDGVYDEDWGRMLRVLGFVPLWLCAGLALALEDRTPWRRLFRSRAGLIMIAPIVGGIVAELLKLLVRRLRPGDLGAYAFRPFTERPLSTGGLGMPSSHALVAFAAAAMLSRIFPRARLLWWSLAWGCGLTRVASGAHFFSDIVVAAIAGWLVGALLWHWLTPRAAAQPQPAMQQSV